MAPEMIEREPRNVHRGIVHRVIDALTRLPRPVNRVVSCDSSPKVELPALHLVVAPSSDLEPVPDTAEGDVRRTNFRWRRHPLLRRETIADEIASEHGEPGARSAAICGLFLARSGRIDDAEAAFTRASRSASIDLAELPGFWDLPRAGMQAAVNAYEANQRYRDAAALGARLRLTYRPRLVRGAPTALRPPSGEATGT